MHKKVAVDVVGNGNMAEVARRMGVTHEAVRRWPVDAAGNITSRIVCDRVLATLVRQNYKSRDEDGLPTGLREQFPEHVLADLLTLPEDAIHILREDDDREQALAA